jgi:hypothetical protein
MPTSSRFPLSSIEALAYLYNINGRAYNCSDISFAGLRLDVCCNRG